MFPLSISEFSTKRWSLFQDILQTTKRELNGIGIWRAKVEDEGIDNAIELIHEMNIAVSSVSWVGGFTGSDGRSHLDAIRDGIETIHFARQIDAECVIVHPGARNGHTDSHSRRLVRSAVKELVEVSSELGVRLALEPMTGGTASDWTFFEGFDDVFSLVSEFATEDVGLVLDLYHLGHRTDIMDRLADFEDRIALVQIADRRQNDFSVGENRLLPGHGCLPIGKWLRQLSLCGYQGRFEIEIHGNEVESMEYGHILDQCLESLYPIRQQLARLEAQREKSTSRDVAKS